MRLQRFFPLALILLVLFLYGYSSVGAATPPTQVSRSGQLFIMQGDPGPNQHLSHQTAHYLKDAQGNITRLTFGSGSPVPPMSASGKWLSVKGTVLTAAQINGANTQGSKTPLLQVQSYQFAAAPASAAAASAPGQQNAVSGPQPWVNIMCRFADVSVTSREPTYVDALMGKMNHYWNEQSYGLVNIAGTQVYGWYTLPSPRSAYFIGSSFDLDKAAQDCTGAADSQVYFPNFVGVNLMFNDTLDCCAWGGATSLSWDGGARSYRVTWLPPWGYENQGVVAHEMGHGFGLPHSSGPYGETYDSGWDVMSNLWFSCPPYDADFGCVAVGTISEHKNMLDWIPPQREYTAPVGTSGTITLERLDLPISTTNYLMAIIPINGSDQHFYTVEARKFAGYDSKVPYDAVVIHDVDLTGLLHVNPANVVDGDHNGVTTDDGSAWTVGESFTDPSNNITVQVISSDTSSYTVALANGVILSPTLTSTFTATAIAPTNTPAFTPTSTATPTSTTVLSTSLKVQYRTADTITSDNAIKPQFKIVNTGTAPVALSELELRYWFTRDSQQTPVFTCDYAQINCANIIGTFAAVNPVNGADYYLSVKFAGVTLNVGQDTGAMNFRINKSDWSTFDENNDYSYNVTLTDFADWNMVGLYRNGVLIWGIEPPGTPVTATLAATATSTAISTMPATATWTTTPTPTFTATLVPSTATNTPTRTFTPVPPTATNTALPPTSTPVVPTNTPIPPVTVASLACQVSYNVYSDYDSGITGRRGFSANIAINNTGSTTITPWTLTWTFPGDQTITELWNATYTQSAQNITVNGMSGAVIYPASNITVGFGGTYSGSNATPGAFYLNGIRCN